MITAASMREDLLADGLLAILRGFDRDGAAVVTEALLEAGVRFVETTVEGSDFEMIGWLRDRFAPEIRAGAGTILTVEQARRAVDAGALYLVSPGLFLDVATIAREAGILYLPGVTTPTEVGLALRAGLDLQKLFPAGLLGPEYLRALRGPYPQLQAVAVGNMTFERIEPMLRAGAAAIALGSAVIGRAGDVPSCPEIAERTRRAREILNRVRAQG